MLVLPVQFFRADYQFRACSNACGQSAIAPSELCTWSSCTMHWEGQYSETPYALSWEPGNRISWHFDQDFCPVSPEMVAKLYLDPLTDHSSRPFFSASFAKQRSRTLPFFPLSDALASHSVPLRFLCQVPSPPLIWGLKPILRSLQMNTLTSCFCLLYMLFCLSCCLSDADCTGQCKSWSQRERAGEKSWL